MKRVHFLFGICALLAIASVWALVPSVVEGAVPQLINFQGILRDSGGNPVTDGTYSVTFTIYDAASGGTVLWTETQSVSTNGGLFGVLLGASNPVPDSVFQGSDRWLGVAVSPDPELSPRQQLVSAGYAFRVNSVNGALGGTISGDVNITGKASIGSSHSNTGLYSFVAGFANTASGTFSTISGGISNSATDSITTVGGGAGNTASNPFATVAGGAGNSANGLYSTITGGQNNRAINFGSMVGGGWINVASGYLSTVSGGDSNFATGERSTVGGGRINRASNYGGTVGGGIFNEASGSAAAVGGGSGNNATSIASTVGGGDGNTASGFNSTVGGGNANIASNEHTTISGGAGNTANAIDAAVGGGILNRALGDGSTIGGGVENTASGAYSIVPGGNLNTSAGRFSFAAGRRAKANQTGVFVWADSTDADFASTGQNQFLIRASGGVGIGTNNPEVALQVDQDAEVASFTGDNNQGLRISGTNTNDRWVLLGFDGGQGKNITQIGSRQTGTGSFLSFGTSSAFGIGITNEAVTIDPSGKVGIGLPAPAHPMHLASGAHVTAGGIWTNASSRSYKTDIQPLKNREYAEILEKLENLDVVRFRYKAEPEREHIGLIAEEVPEEMASVDRKGIPTADAIAFLTAALKAQQSQIENLRETVRQLQETRK